MKEAIVAASVSLLKVRGLNNWTVARAASQAGCAKGLVIYHFGSKAELLRQSAERLGRERMARRLAAVRSASGAQVLDALWQAIADDVESGAFAAWVELVAERAAGPRAQPNPTAAGVELRTAVARAFGLGLEDLPDGLTINAILDGASLALLQGASTRDVEAAYQVAWLGLLG